MKKIFTLFAAVLFAGSMMAAWDGTITLNKSSINSIADLEGLTLTFNGATSVVYQGDDAGAILLQNEDGSILYAIHWQWGNGSSVSVEGSVATLTGWAVEEDWPALPETSCTLYLQVYTSFTVDGEAAPAKLLPIDFGTTPAGPIELEFTSAEAEVYGTLLDVFLSGPNISLLYELTIANKSIAGIHNDAKEENIVLTYDIEEYLEDPILEGSAEFTFVSVDESGVYTYIVSFNLVGVSGNNYHAEAEIQVHADLSNDVTPTALENTNAEVKATKLVENGQVVILRDGKKFNLVGAQL